MKKFPVMLHFRSDPALNSRWGYLHRLSRTARLLIVCRLCRSIGQGALVVDFALYLHALHWNGAQMGAVYTGGLLVGAVLTLFSGPLSDRIGRRPFLIGYDVVQVLAALTALVTSTPVLLVAAAVLGAFGRGANGAAGPFGPVEQAWLATDLADADFGPVYSFNIAISSIGMGIGCLFAILPGVWQSVLPGALAFRPLFLLVLIGSLITLALLWSMDDRKPEPAADAGGPSDVPEKDRRSEARSLVQLVSINALNGLGIGIISPFMAYWFHLRFGVGAAAIGPIIGLGFFLSSIAALWTGWLTRRVGTVRSVVIMRVLGLGLFVLLPFAPSYGWAAACYVLRAACNRGTAGARQVVGLRLVGAGRRGLAASLNAISMQVPRAFGPIIGGLLLDAQMLALPMLLAAGLQGAYVVLYGKAFRSSDVRDRPETGGVRARP